MMPSGKGDDFSGNFNAPIVTGSTVSGGVHSHGDFVLQPAGASVPAVLIAQLGELRAKVETLASSLPKTEVALDSIDDLTADVQAMQDGQDPEPAVARSRWEKIKGLLGGATQVTADLATIGHSVAQLFGPA
jgi:hypothetical protein